MTARQALANSRRWVVKIGSSLLTNHGRGLDHAAIADWVDQIAALKQQGLELVLVSSGSVAEGMNRLGLKQRPAHVHELQAAAAVGQMGLIQAYESHFARHDLHTAQILLTHDDLSDRRRYLNARSTLRVLLRMNTVPVVNENDTVVTDEICFGDNDTLAALVCNLVEADALVILTDQAGLYSADPRRDTAAELISEAAADDARLAAMAGGSGVFGRGGMITKVRAAQTAARSGAHTVIVGGKQADVLKRLFDGDPLGTLLTASQAPWAARKQWLAGHLQTRGTITLDEGAVNVLKQAGRSLLAVGVTRVEGDFQRGELVACLSPDGRTVARGLINYDAADTRRIIGQPSEKIESILGYAHAPELIHRDNLALAD